MTKKQKIKFHYLLGNKRLTRKYEKSKLQLGFDIIGHGKIDVAESFERGKTYFCYNGICQKEFRTKIR